MKWPNLALQSDGQILLQTFSYVIRLKSNGDVDNGFAYMLLVVPIKRRSP